MSAFLRGMNFGIIQGIVNNMLGFGCYGNFGNLGFISGWSNPFCCNFMTPIFNMNPTFMVPRLNFNNFYMYQSPQDQINLTPNNTNLFGNYTGGNCIGQTYPNFVSFPNQNLMFGDFGDTISFSNKEKETSETETEQTVSTPQNNTEPPERKTGIKTQTHQPKITKHSKHWSQMSDAEMKQIYGNYDRQINTTQKGTSNEVNKLNKYLKGKGVLEGKGQAFINAQNKYGISASVLVAICMNESGRGTSNLARKKNNVGGVRICGLKEFRSFDKVDDCINYMAQFLQSKYVHNSKHPLTKLYQVNAKYCPVSDTTDKTGGNKNWARAVEKYASDVEKILA